MFKYLSFSLLLVSLISCEKKVENKVSPQTSTQQKEKSKPENKTEAAPKENVKLRLGVKALSEKTKNLGEILSKDTGYEIEFIALETPSKILSAMKKDKVQIVFGDAWLYLNSHHLADGTLLAVESTKGKIKKESAWFTQADSKLSIDKLKKKKIVFSSQNDLAGYFFPYASLIKSGALKKGEDLNKTFSSVLFSGTRKAVLEDLIAKRADAGPALLEDFESLSPENKKKLKILSPLEPVPNNCFFARSGTKLSVLYKLRDSLIAASKTKEGASLLKELYGVGTLQESSHSDLVHSIEIAENTVGHKYIFSPSKAKKK